MSKLTLFGVLCIVFASLASGAERELKAIGFVVENPVIAEADNEAEPAATLRAIRGGRELQLREGDEVFAGDILSTDPRTSISVAFVDQSAVRLFPSTELRLDPNPLASGILGGTFVQGHASVLFQTAVKTSGELTLGTGARSVKARAASSGGSAKLDIIVQKDDQNKFLASVGVVAGTVTLQMVGGIGLAGSISKTGVQVNAGGSLALTLLTPVKGVTSPDPVTLTQGNLTKEDLTAMRLTAVAEYLVSTAKGGVKITATIKESDGTVTVVKETVVAGVVSKDSSQTKDPLTKKTIASWSESSTKVSFKKTYLGYALSALMSKTGAPGKATVKGPSGISYKGTSIYDPVTGLVTFQTTAPGKDGSSVLIMYDPRGNKGTEETLILTGKDGKSTQTITTTDRLTGLQVKTVQTGIVVNGKFASDGTPPVKSTITFAPNSANPITPDGHSIDQNNPPPVLSQ